MSETQKRPSQKPGPSQRPRPWTPILILIVVAFIAAAWSVIWFMAEKRVNQRFDLWLANQQAQGHAWRCVNRQSGGYPFRLDIRCGEVHGDVKTRDGRHFDLLTGPLTMVSRAYAPGHVITELSGPLIITPRDDPDATFAKVEWRELRASVKARIGAGNHVDIDNVDIAAADIAGEVPGLARFPGIRNVFKADAAEFHARLAARRADSADIDLAASAAGLIIDPQSGAVSPTDADFLATLFQVPLRAAGDRLQAFAEAKGKLLIDRLTLNQGGATIRLNGTLALDSAFRPTGALQLAARGNDLNVPGAQGAFGGVLPILALTLRFAGRPAEIDGQPATAADLVLNDGEIRFGSMSLGQVPALR